MSTVGDLYLQNILCNEIITHGNYVDLMYMYDIFGAFIVYTVTINNSTQASTGKVISPQNILNKKSALVVINSSLSTGVHIKYM